ncbi:MAG: nitrophenyl compound nitroreductase subunit ArsF family protein [Lentisphaeria bacterium]|jgi:hypothetical protein
MKLKKGITGLLLGFVLFSLGYGVGREVTLRQAGGERLAAAPAAAPAERVAVLYLHGNLRCAGCLAIERMVQETVAARFPDELAAGVVELRTLNFQKVPKLARCYDVLASTVVVVRIQGGKEVAFRRLDGVWEQLEDPAAFEAYLADAVAAWLPGGRG